MGKALVRIGDTSDHGGYMITARSWIQCGGKLMCVDQDIHQCPIEYHGNTPVSTTSAVKARGAGILRVGDRAGCGATIISGDNNTNSK